MTDPPALPGYLSPACREDYTTHRRAHKGVPSKLRAADAFRNTIVKAKDVVRRLINRKIDDFVDLAELEWCARTPLPDAADMGAPLTVWPLWGARTGSRTPPTVSSHASNYLEGAKDAAARQTLADA